MVRGTLLPVPTVESYVCICIRVCAQALIHVGNEAQACVHINTHVPTNTCPCVHTYP